MSEMDPRLQRFLSNDGVTHTMGAASSNKRGFCELIKTGARMGAVGLFMVIAAKGALVAGEEVFGSGDVPAVSSASTLQTNLQAREALLQKTVDDAARSGASCFFVGPATDGRVFGNGVIPVNCDAEQAARQISAHLGLKDEDLHRLRVEVHSDLGVAEVQARLKNFKEGTAPRFEAQSYGAPRG